MELKSNLKLSIIIFLSGLLFLSLVDKFIVIASLSFLLKSTFLIITLISLVFILPLNQLLSKLKPGGVFVDVKSIYSADEITSKGFRVWRL